MSAVLQAVGDDSLVSQADSVIDAVGVGIKLRHAVVDGGASPDG